MIILYRLTEGRGKVCPHPLSLELSESHMKIRPFFFRLHHFCGDYNNTVHCTPCAYGGYALDGEGGILLKLMLVAWRYTLEVY